MVKIMDGFICFPLIVCVLMSLFCMANEWAF
jgi:hypothetical protein